MKGSEPAISEKDQLQRAIHAWQVLKTDAQKAFTMLKKMVVEPSEMGTPKASKNAMIPLDFLKRCKVVFDIPVETSFYSCLQGGQDFSL